ncbi:hypothetical protein OQX61_07860 [Pedobacter sp. PLR]|uniref:hypothetical protein n=1 Tax=Pedobacter sp. PLR TaxID=2994465 RepID=UPI0022464C74|nr:hypothetical protein [Pedobacter sp. PLR]MCX2451183.1 hypothetical protein [Pedobacter sp. PLR]
MRKILLLLLCTAALGLSSCKKEVIVDPGLPNETIEKIIRPAAWIPNSNRTTLTATIPFSELDEETFLNDGLIVSLYTDNAIPEYSAMPFVFGGETYSYTVKRGFIIIDIQTTGDPSILPNPPIRDMGLRVTFVTSTLR